MCDLGAAAALLVRQTDVCVSVLMCSEEAMRRLPAPCDVSDAQLQLAQSMWASMLRMYRPILAQHPSLPLTLESVIGGAGAGRRDSERPLDVVLSRCDATLRPLLRLLPALLDPPGSTSLMRPSAAARRAPGRLRVFVYERCMAVAARDAGSRALDVRHRLFSLHRMAATPPAAMRSAAGAEMRADHAADLSVTRTLQAHAAALAHAKLRPASLTLALTPRALRVLAESERHSDAEDAPALRAASGASRGHLRAPDALAAAARADWASLGSAVAWSDARGEAARAIAAMAAAVHAPRGEIASASSYVRDCDNASLALLSRTPPRGAILPRGARSRPNAAAAPSGACAAGGDGARVDGARGWPQNASSVGFCAVTNDAVEGDCRGGTSGSWNTRIHRIRSCAPLRDTAEMPQLSRAVSSPAARAVADCAGRCLRCARCRYVTYSAENDDCSWCVTCHSCRHVSRVVTCATCRRYATCRLNALGADPAYASVRVRPARGDADDDIGGGGATASSLSFAEGLPVLGRRSGKRAPEHALAALRAHEAARVSDRAWHVSLVRGAISQLLGAIGVEHPAEPVIGGAPRGGIVGLEASAVGVERGSRRGGAVLAVPFDCVDPDYVEHNRMLLPGARFPASCHVAERRHGAESAHAGGARSLRERVARLREAAEAAHCADADGAAGFELHPSGFTSMLSSAIKPWTLALRLGRALFTPRSAAIFDGARCKRRDLGCIFEPIGPACEM